MRYDGKYPSVTDTTVTQKYANYSDDALRSLNCDLQYNYTDSDGDVSCIILTLRHPVNSVRLSLEPYQMHAASVYYFACTE